jgi:hypothetical protein
MYVKVLERYGMRFITCLVRGFLGDQMGQKLVLGEKGIKGNFDYERILFESFTRDYSHMCLINQGPEGINTDSLPTEQW